MDLIKSEATSLDAAVLDVRRMAAADRLATEQGTTSLTLMENAGRAIVAEIERRWSPRAVVILCGPGNNGGDGFVVAKLLKDAGWPVRVGLLGSRDRLTGDAKDHAAQWLGSVEVLTAELILGAELVVDALVGAGLNRPLDGAAAQVLEAVALSGLPVVAVDVPSGVMGDTGQSLGAVAATLTVTFFRKKPGHLLMPGRALCGEIVVADIGIPSSVLTSLLPNTFENSPTLWLSQLPRPKVNDHKYDRGHALIVGGYPMTGAARLAARGAARAGAGLTTLAVPEIALPIYAASLTSTMVCPIASAEDLELLLLDKRLSGLLVGPGAGTSETTRETVLAMLATQRPTVLDADALTAFREDPQLLHRAIAGPCVMTPHDGEFARLFDASGDKLTRTRRAAHSSGAVVVLKGSDTVIAAPDGRAIINSNAPPTLATAGAGDVLAGIIVGLLAQQMDPFFAAAAAVWMHGAAATEFGPGLIADDLPDMLPAVLRRLDQLSLVTA